MPAIKIKVQGIEDIRKRFKGLYPQVDAAIDDALFTTIQRAARDVRKGINSGPASGRVYEYEYWTDGNGKLRQGKKRSKPHQASAPGEAPMTDKGTLARSVAVDLTSGGKHTVSVGSALVYASFLEWGTRRMAPRPIWTPVSETIPAILSANIEEELALIVLPLASGPSNEGAKK